MNFDYELISRRIIVPVARVLDEIVAEQEHLESPLQTLFHGNKRPSISLEQYLLRIQQFTYSSNEVYILALIYLDRIQELHTDLIITGQSVHRFLLAAIVLGIKYQDDAYYRNEYYAKVGGIPTEELSQLEVELLELLEYKLYVSQNLYSYYKDRLLKYSQI